jgi:hypothetical protein
MGPIVCPETSVIYYHYSLRNNQEERRSLVLHGGKLNSRIKHFCVNLDTVRS